MTDTPTPSAAHTPLPCPNPWCASHETTDAEIRAYHTPVIVPHGSLYYAACPVCPINGPKAPSETEAWSAWNIPARAAEKKPQESHDGV